MILPGETEAGTAGTQPCRGISRWAHRDDERRREVSFLRRPNLHRIERPHALKIPARRAEYSLTENVASPFQAEPTQRQVRFTWDASGCEVRHGYYNHRYRERERLLVSRYQSESPNSL